MHERLLARAAWPAPVIVLGLPLKSFSLGHELLLTRKDNPLALGPYLSPSSRRPKVLPHQLKQAVLICCHTWRQNQRVAYDPLIRLKLAIWKFRCRHMNFERELLGFLHFRASGSLEFPLSDIDIIGQSQSGRLPGTPFILRLQQFKVIQGRLSDAEAWDYPIGLAKCEWACFWEQEQGLQVQNEAEEEYDRKAQAMLEKIEAEERAKEGKCRDS